MISFRGQPAGAVAVADRATACRSASAGRASVSFRGAAHARSSATFGNASHSAVLRTQRRGCLAGTRKAFGVRAAIMENTSVDEGVPSEKEVENGWRRIVGDKIEQGRGLWAACRDATVAAAQPASTWAGIRQPHKVILSDVIASPKRGAIFNRTWSKTDFAYMAFIGLIHVGAVAAPFFFTWSAFYSFLAMYFVTGCIGITYSFHRQLSHKSFQSPKWLEYAAAYCGALAVQGDPIEWVSSHRTHHVHTDTPKDPHTPYEGFWWSHAGWLLDNDATLARVADRGNAVEMANQPFYRFIASTYIYHIVASAAVTFAIGGLPGFLWAFCFRTAWVWHITWFVNSASHVWGTQPFRTGDLSRNNWWVGILAFGEGWHNNHHAFEFSARHGLEWWQVDVTWYIVRALQAVGLVSKVKLPKAEQMRRLRYDAAPA